jgi:ABC-type hemin transport system substrate-binding protein
MMQMKIKRLSILGFIILLLLYPLWAYTPPKRIVSLAPNITEMLFRIGAGALLIGRTEF